MTVFHAFYDALAQTAFRTCYPSMPLPTPGVVADLTMHEVHRAIDDLAKLTGQDRADVLQTVTRAALVSTEAAPVFHILPGQTIPDFV